MRGGIYTHSILYSSGWGVKCLLVYFLTNKKERHAGGVSYSLSKSGLPARVTSRQAAFFDKLRQDVHCLFNGQNGAGEQLGQRFPAALGGNPDPG